MGQTLKALTARLLLSFNINLAFMEGAMKSRALAEIKSAGQRLTERCLPKLRSFFCGKIYFKMLIINRL
ncbi:hypothetical protein DXM29_20735 [Agrobacterium tumefaciens]|nr:hypothetical protein DXM29_20735 [Agrobacterium tumefaciens]